MNAFANLTSSDHSTKTSSPISPRFFALSAYAMKTEVQEQLDGYTILWLPNQAHDNPQLVGAEGADDDVKKQKPKHADKRGNDFVVFKVCQNSLY